MRGTDWQWKDQDGMYLSSPFRLHLEDQFNGSLCDLYAHGYAAINNVSWILFPCHDDSLYFFSMCLFTSCLTGGAGSVGEVLDVHGWNEESEVRARCRKMSQTNEKRNHSREPKLCLV